jgi:type IV secretory pathway VirB10-like protein
MDQPLEVPSPPRPQRLNRLALVAVLALLGVAVAAVFMTLAPPRQTRAAAESPEGSGPARPGFLERGPAGTAPAPRAAPAEAPKYWQDALREGRTPRGSGGVGAADGLGATGAADALDAAGAAGQGLLEPGASPPGMAAAERARTPAPSAREAAYRRALLAPVTPARGAMEAAEGAEEGAVERMARQPGSLPLPALPGLPGLPAMPSLPALLGLPAPAATGVPAAAPGGPPMMPAALLPAGIAAGQPPEGAGAAGAGGVAAAMPGGGAAAATTGGDRRDHQAFLRGAETLAPAELRVRHDRPGAGIWIEAGTVLPAALVTAVDSDVAGPLVAQVTQDVFDRDQRRVVIPRGSRLLGSYDSQVALGESRLLVAWSRVVFPDGSGLSFPGLPAATRAGEAGLPGSVDNHLARVFGSAVLLSVLGAGAQLSQPQESAAFGAAASTRQVAAAAVGQELSSVAIELLRRQLSVPPTIRIAAGTRFYVFLRGDVRFEEPPARE